MDSRAVARKLAEEAIVLLKNEERTLPFQKGQKVAFLGRAQIDTIYSGNGSGAVQVEECKNILEACEERGILAEPELKAYYQECFRKEKEMAPNEPDERNLKEMVNSGIMYEIFGKYHEPAEEYAVSEEQIQKACAYTDIAVLMLGRNSGGEECDRHLQEDYYLTESEKVLVERTCQSFGKVVLVLNVNGLIDLSWTSDYTSLKSILFIGIPGEEGSAALAEILAGNVNPSGKLPVTIAAKYEDYPSASHFSWDKEKPEGVLTYNNYGLCAEENGSTGYDRSPVTVYWEDIYAGYRYFDTFEKEPLFAFGYGLSYTDFEMETVNAVKEPDGISIAVHVKNTGCEAGKETVQVYLSAFTGKTERAYQELKGFEKTELLKPGEEQEVHVFIPWKELSCYKEEKAVYVIEQGKYQLLAGNSSRNTAPAVCVTVEEDILVEQCAKRLAINPCNRSKLSFLSQTEDIVESMQEKGQKQAALCGQEIVLRGDIRLSGTAKREENRYKDVAGNLSVEQLAALCVGYGPGTPFAGLRESNDPETIFDGAGNPVTTNSHPAGFNGYVSPAIEEEGISSVFYKDGPAGIGGTAWPSEMLIACAFNKKLWYEFGNAVGAECERRQVDVWLAPAVNLHRHPLGGRNFEYFSEDPYLTGVCACEMTKGVQENHPVIVCPKHFAINEQETYRRGSLKKNYDAVDSIIGERAARELYLKPFEMLVKDAEVFCIMTSFNKINGVFAGGNADLCTHILREEWGFEGAVVTDWGDMDVVVDGADAVAAGNDIVMPGGPPVIAQILAGYEEGRLTRDALEKAVEHLLNMVEKTGRNR